jgi:hypothetical protein
MSASDHVPPRRSSAPAWNRAAASLLLLLAGWTLAADLAHPGHFLLQGSLSSLFLGLFVSLWMLAAVAFARFPKRFVISAAILATARLSFGWPLSAGMDFKTSCLLLDALLLGLGFAYLATSIRGEWLGRRPAIRWQHSAAMGAAVMGASVLSVPVGLLGLARVVEEVSAGYVRLAPGGIDLTERIFEKDGRRVHLFGMAHIADGGFYETLNEVLAEPLEGHRLVLLEGVSDKEGIMPKSFASGKTYGDLARRFGLAEQSVGFAVSAKMADGADSRRQWEERGVDFRNADVDLGELSPEHRDRLVALLVAMEDLSLASLFAMPEGMDAAELEDLIVEGLIRRRNERLMEVFAEAEAGYAEIFIPWGAAHLPDVERRLESLGYRAVEERRRRGIDFWRRFR